MKRDCVSPAALCFPGSVTLNIPILGKQTVKTFCCDNALCNNSRKLKVKFFQIFVLSMTVAVYLFSH